MKTILLEFRRHTTGLTYRESWKLLGGDKEKEETRNGGL